MLGSSGDARMDSASSSASWIDETFPGLRYDVTSEPDDRYNCISWALGQQDVWWSHLPGYRWVGYRSPTIETLEDVFLALGYERCDSDDLEDGYDKVALFAQGNRWTHAARQLPDSRWTSKLGVFEDIEHDSLDAISGRLYGEVHCIVRRRRRT